MLDEEDRAALRPGGKVSVRCAARGRRLRIEVHDTGAGIAGEDLERLFRPFERLPSSAGQPGTGLGLYLARRVVEAMGGSISVESELGARSTFSLELPLA